MKGGTLLLGAIAVALIAAANTGEPEQRPVSDVAPAPVQVQEPAGITAYADDPARGAELCAELVRSHLGMECHVEPAANSPHGTPWWLGNDGTSWSVG